MRRVLFIDRDGTLIKEPEDEQVDQISKFEFVPNVIYVLSRIVRELDYLLVLVTNQDGLGTDTFPESDFWPVQNLMMDIFRSQGIEFENVCIDNSRPEDGRWTRKPGLGMLQKYVHGPYQLNTSFVIGDRMSDVELAENLGSQSILIGNSQSLKATFQVEHWEQIYAILKDQYRTSQIRRQTSETDIDIHLNLDGMGEASIQTGLGFFDHMLEQLATHGGLDLRITAKGDLHIDEHHLIEDVAIALGEAISEALADKCGIERYGFVLPMDDALAQVTIDFGGRPWCIWDVDFQREMIGGLPTEMFFHFFKSFSDSAQCNLNIKAEGKNEHHKIEAIFKAFARAMKAAVRKSDHLIIPSTKGRL